MGINTLSASSSLTGCHSMSKSARSATRAVLEDVEPPRIRRLRDAHVVGHQVHDVPHAARFQRVDPAPVIGLGPEVGVEARGVGDVVAVRAPGNRLQIRRRVAIADAEGVEIVDDVVGVAEGEAPVQLQTIG